MRFATVATVDHRAQLERLARSLALVHPGAPLVVHVDDAGAFAGLPNADVELVELRTVRDAGAKQAKFEVYANAGRDGAFVYLDADVVVLEPLDELVAAPGLIACPDDLRASPYIADRTHPWPGAPDLRNEVYVNAGVLGFGADAAELTQTLLQHAQSPGFWDAHVFPGKLYDQHVLCAILNRQGIRPRLLSEHRYNWQGFRDPDGRIAARRDGDALVHGDTGERLALVHFAAIWDIDEYLLWHAPPEIAQLLNAASVAPLGFTRALAAASAGRTDLRVPLEDDNRGRTHDVLAEALRDAQDGLVAATTPPSGYVRTPDDVIAVVLAGPPRPETRWNGLLCGGAYLEPDEYCVLRAVVHAYARDGVAFEFGAGETTAVLAGHARRAISIEPSEGPWLDRARTRGAEVHHMPFAHPDGFDAERLHAVLADVPAIDLLLVDSPVGCAARTVALRQLLQLRRPRCVVFHDARRDALPLMAELQQRGYELGPVHASARGLAVLVLPADAPSVPAAAPAPNPPPAPSADAPVCPPGLSGFTAELTLPGAGATVPEGRVADTVVTLRNPGDEIWLIGGPHPVKVTYHVHRDGQMVLYEGLRTPLPCDLHPGDTVTFPMSVDPLDLAPGTYELDVCLVEEGRTWFDAVEPGSSARCALTISAAGAAS